MPGATPAVDVAHAPPTSSYREFPAHPALGRYLACAWVQIIGSGNAPFVQRVLPDGCIDIVATSGAPVLVAGPDTTGKHPRLSPGSVTVGARFRPGIAPIFLGAPADVLLDATVPLDDLWGNEASVLAERMAVAGSPTAGIQVIEAALCRRLGSSDGPDEMVVAAVRRLSTSPGVKTGQLGEDLGLSERQLLRKFNAAVGYGPKMLARVLRLRRFLAVAGSSTAVPPLAALAADAGYADQAHLTRECRELAGLTPTSLLAA